MPSWDSATAAAEQALSRHHPWQATLAISPVLREPRGRTPKNLLLAARAAAGWEGWAQVQRLLVNEPWLDREFDGAGRAMLARAALERHADSAALLHGRAALQDAPSSAPERGERFLLLARAEDRLKQFDSAATHYVQAAGLLPSIADWLVLRSAGVTADSTTRAAEYRRITLPASLPRIRWTEALAQERLGDPAKSAGLYEALGAHLQSIRVRLKAAVGDSVRMDLLRHETIGLLPHLNADEARNAVALLESTFSGLTPEEELAVARKAAAIGWLDRAEAGFVAAETAGLLTNTDFFALGTVRFRSAMWSEARAAFDRVTEPTLRPGARYQHARAILASGQPDSARDELRGIAKEFSRDTAAASSALFLTADLLADRGSLPESRARFLKVFGTYPTSAFAGRARFQAALLLYLQQGYRKAAAEFDGLWQHHAGSEEALAALYWSGRAQVADHDTAVARERWLEVIRRSPQSYYAYLAAERLGVSVWSPPPAIDSTEPPPPGIFEPVFARIGILDRLGLGAESRLELEYLIGEGDRSVNALRVTAEALSQHGYPGRAQSLAQLALDRGGPRDERLYRLLYPWPERVRLEEQARAVGLDPALLAGLIRQESAFDAHAKSRADARGWMQVLPSLGAQMAKSVGIAEWDPVLLYQPEINVHFGLAHLMDAVHRYPDPVQFLAAYNAGDSRVDRWLTKRGAVGDSELFVELIPFVETRDYVRRILRNQEFYRALYGREMP